MLPSLYLPALAGVLSLMVSGSDALRGRNIIVTTGGSGGTGASSGFLPSSTAGTTGIYTNTSTIMSSTGTAPPSGRPTSSSVTTGLFTNTTTTIPSTTKPTSGSTTGTLPTSGKGGSTTAPTSGKGGSSTGGVTTKPTSGAAGPSGFTTSTAYTTKVYTITACPATVTNCPVGKVVTKTIALYTTVCPVTGATTTPPPPGPPSSVVYTTQIITVTACPATVTNCPASSTKVYTTVYPVPTPSSTAVVVLTVVPTPGASKPAGGVPTSVITVIPPPAKTNGTASGTGSIIKPSTSPFVTNAATQSGVNMLISGVVAGLAMMLLL